MATQESIYEQDVIVETNNSTDRCVDENEVDMFAESLNDSSFKVATAPGDTRTRFKGLISEICQVLDFKKDRKSDEKFETLLSSFVTEQRAELHKNNVLKRKDHPQTVSILAERETCSRPRVYNTKNYFRWLNYLLYFFLCYFYNEYLMLIT